MRGKLIVLEGIDKSGKSTQAKLLQKHVPNSVLLSFPNRSNATGSLIHSYLQSKQELENHCIHLLFSATRWEDKDKILSYLEQGIHVILDRYVTSGWVYSIAKGMDPTWCKMADRGLLRPDLTFLIHVHPQELAQREGYGGERYERLEFQTKVAHLFQEYCTGVVLDGMRGIQDIHEDIKTAVDPVLERDMPLLYLE
jgi:dTMP kinase